MSDLRHRLDAALAEQWPRKVCRRVEVALPYPPTVNGLYSRSGDRVVRSPRYASWWRVASTDVAVQRPGHVPGQYRLTVVLGRPDRRRRDLDNPIKAVSDLLVAHRVIDDDHLAQEISIRWSDDGSGCRAIVEAWEAA